MLTEFDKLVVRAWSAVAARGGSADAAEVFAELRKRPGLVMECADLSKKLNELRLRRCLP